jgi:superfamily I DNA/RNA helicase
MPENSWAGIPYGELEPEQKDFLRSVLSGSNTNYFLHGCAGSGKTVMAAHGTRLLTEEGKSVQFIVYTKLLSKFVSDGFDDVGQSMNEVDHYHNWRKSFSISGNYDFAIIDECQDFEPNWIQTVKEHSVNQIWLGDPTQQIYDGKEGYRGISSEFREREFVLKVNYRNSISIAQLATAFMEVNEFDTVTIEEKKRDFIAPIIKNASQISSANNQPNIFIEAENEQDEYDCIAKIVKDIQNNNETKKHIAIVQLHHDDRGLDNLERELNARDVEFLRITKGKTLLPDFNDNSLTLLSPIHSLKGLEFDYIIFPRTDDHNNAWSGQSTNNALMHVLFSRARRRIYCSYTSKDSSFIYQAIADDLDNDFYEFVTSQELLNDGMPTKSEDEVSKNIAEVEKKLKDYFDDLDIE